MVYLGIRLVAGLGLVWLGARIAGILRWRSDDRAAVVRHPGVHPGRTAQSTREADCPQEAMP